jgi:hypothetical protein
MLRGNAANREPETMTPSLTKSTMLVCRLCRLEANHNEVLGLTYCPIHGLDSPLDSRGNHSSRINC